MKDAATVVDRLLPERAIVIGSLPPGGRDLDLLVRPEAEAALARGLGDEGFEGHGQVFARFRDCTAEVVDLIPAGDWGLPDGELAALCEEALPVDGFERLARPSPAHVVLILARRFAGDLRGRLDEKRRARLAAALLEDPDAWSEAAARADAWGVAEPLRGLRAAYEGDAPAGPRLPRRIPRPRRGALITFSGLDGSGKSSQAEALRDALDALGYDAVVVWTSLVAHPARGAIGEPVKKVLRALRRGGGEAAPAEEWAQPASVESADPARAMRQKSGLLTQVWATYVALVNAWWQTRATRGHLLRGRVVICDRWTLDSKVQMRYQYGASRRFGVQTLLVRLLSPRPRRAYLLDISAEEAARRKPEYTVEQNEQRAALYREDYEALGVVRLDGERAREELCVEVAREVWRGLEA